jgi:aspartyl-tRNA(Asn)/glutamyl-tRNA(Gln) amidotransferase subunit C
MNESSNKLGMEVDKALILKLETLTRLELSDEERGGLLVSLNNILVMIDKLNELDTTGVEPLVYINDNQNRWREDVVKNQVEKEDVFRNAPNHNKEHFKVPKIM